MRKKRKVWKEMLTEKELLEYDNATIELWRNSKFENCLNFARKYDMLGTRVDLEEPGASVMIVNIIYNCFRKVMMDYDKKDVKKAFQSFKEVTGTATIFLYKSLCGLANMLAVNTRDVNFLIKVLPLVQGKANKNSLNKTIENIQFIIGFDNMLEGRPLNYN